MIIYIIATLTLILTTLLVIIPSLGYIAAISDKSRPTELTSLYAYYWKAGLGEFTEALLVVSVFLFVALTMGWSIATLLHGGGG